MTRWGHLGLHGCLVRPFLGPFLCPLIGIEGPRFTSTQTEPERPRPQTLCTPQPAYHAWFSIVVLDDMIVKGFASLLPGSGTISELQYARTLMKVPMGVFGMAAGMPHFQH